MATLKRGAAVIPTTPEQWKAIERAISRFLKISNLTDKDASRMNLEIMLDMVNRATPLDLVRLADVFDDFNLVHDVAGMAGNVNRDGTLNNCFVPRCTLPTRDW